MFAWTNTSVSAFHVSTLISLILNFIQPQWWARGYVPNLSFKCLNCTIDDRTQYLFQLVFDGKTVDTLLDVVHIVCHDFKSWQASLIGAFSLHAHCHENTWCLVPLIIEFLCHNFPSRTPLSWFLGIPQFPRQTKQNTILLLERSAVEVRSFKQRDM